MGEFIVNPRQAPRAPVRCEARIALKEGGFWASPTSDYGPRGCQLLAPGALAPGARIFVELVNERVRDPVGLAGRIAWTAKAPPWRTGIAFDEGSVPAAAGFFDRLAAAYPGIDAYGKAPERLAQDAPLAPAPPPEFEPLLTADEAFLLSEVGAGIPAGALRARLGERWTIAIVNALFALLGRRYLLVRGPDEAAAAAWAALRGPPASSAEK